MAEVAGGATKRLSALGADVYLAAATTTEPKD